MSGDSTVVYPLCELITLKLSRSSLLEKPEKQRLLMVILFPSSPGPAPQPKKKKSVTVHLLKTVYKLQEMFAKFIEYKLDKL